MLLTQTTQQIHFLFYRSEDAPKSDLKIIEYGLEFSPLAAGLLLSILVVLSGREQTHTIPRYYRSYKI